MARLFSKSQKLVFLSRYYSFASVALVGYKFMSGPTRSWCDASLMEVRKQSVYKQNISINLILPDYYWTHSWLHPWEEIDVSYV